MGNSPHQDDDKIKIRKKPETDNVQKEEKENASTTESYIKLMLESEIQTSLDLTDAELNFSDEILQELKKTKNLHSLNLTRKNTNVIGYVNSVGEKGAQIVSEILKKNNFIEELNLSKCEIKNIGAKYISEILVGNTGLLKLNLTNNEIGDNGIVDLCEVLEKNETLEELDLKLNLFKEKASQAIGTMLKMNKNITHLNMSRNRVDFRKIGEGIDQNKSLKKLQLICCTMNDYDFCEFIELIKFSNIEELDLSDNDFNLSEKNSTILKGMLNLKCLNLSNNFARHDCISFTSLHVRHLNLSDTFVDKDFSDTMQKYQCELFKGLLVNEFIHEFIFQNNYISMENFEVILDVVKRNENLRVFDISHYRYRPLDGYFRNSFVKFDSKMFLKELEIRAVTMKNKSNHLFIVNLRNLKTDIFFKFKNFQ
eukprot:gene4113-7399_t